MSVLDRKLLRDLWQSKGTLAAVMGIIAAGTCCYVAMASSFYNLALARDRYYARCRMADFSVELKKMPTAELQRLASIRGVTDLRPRIIFPVTVDLAKEPKPLSGQLLSLPDDRVPVINDVVITRGSYFRDRRRSEIIVNDAFAKARDLKPGDELHLLLNNRRQPFTIVGTAISSEFVYLIGPGSLVPDPKNYGVFYVSHTRAEEIFDFEGACNQILGRLTEDRQERPRLILDRIEQLLDEYGVATTTPREQQVSHRFISDEINGLRVSSVIMPGIFLSVAVLVLNVLMMRWAEQQRTVIGTLKALGYSRLQVMAHFLKFGLSVGVLGGLAGTLFGYLLAGGMTAMYREFYQFPRLVNQVYPSVFLIGVAISTFFSCAGTLRGVRSIMKLNPAAAMRPKPPPSAKGIWLERFTWLWPRLGFGWHIVLRNVFRQRGRTAAGIFAAMMGTALLVTSFFSLASVDHLIDFQFDKVMLSDFELAFKDASDAGAYYEAADLPSVDRVEYSFAVACTFRHGRFEKKAAITGLEPGADLTVPRDSQGRRVGVPQTGLLLTAALADYLHVRPGQVLEIKPHQGLREPKPVRVAGVVDSYLGLSAYANYHYLNGLVDEEDAVSALQLKVQPGADREEQFYHALKRLPTIEAVSAVRDAKANLVDTFIKAMRFSMGFMIGFAGVIFMGSILNSSLISISERQREIATFQVLGYSNWAVGVLFLRESLLVNMTGALIGLPLGHWLSTAMAELYATEMFRMPVIFRTGTLVWTMIIALIFTLIAHVLVQRQINRLDWRGALNTKE